MDTEERFRPLLMRLTPKASSELPGNNLEDELKFARFLTGALEKKNEYKKRALENLNLEKDLRRKKDLVEGAVARVISEEVTDTGKPKFSNETSRRVELQMRLAQDKGFQELLTKLESTEKESRGLEIHLDEIHDHLNWIENFFHSNLMLIFDPVTRISK